MLAPLCKSYRFESVEALPPAPFKRGSAIVLMCCILSIIACISPHSTAGEATSDAKDTSPRPLALRLPDILRRKHQGESDSKQVQSGRFVTRAIQLLGQARDHEASGNHQTALETAQRAESIAKAIQDTAGVRWPNGQESPAQYIAALKRRIGVADKPAAVPVVSAEFTPSTFQLFERMPATVAVPPGDAANLSRKPATPFGNIGSVPNGSESLTAAAAVNPNASGQSPNSNSTLKTRPTQAGSDELLLLWASRLHKSEITLTGATQAADESSPDVGLKTASNETGQLLQQLDELETWSAIEPPAGESSYIRIPTTISQGGENPTTESSPPLIIPGLIDRPDGIDDQQVGPIPTRSTDTVEGSASEAITTTIPVVPETIDAPPKQIIRNTTSSQKSDTEKQASDSLVNVYQTSPRLLTQSVGTTAAAMTETGSNSAGIWQLAVAQFIATFFGVILAVGLFLLIRVAAVRVFGSQLGVTFQFGSMSGRSVQAAPVAAPDDDVSSDTESSTTVVGSSTTQSEKLNPVGRIDAPADFPLRVVGTSNGEGDSAAEIDIPDQGDASILKSVFDNNLELMSQLDKQNGSAA
jgi:hypothetical protein